MKWLFFAIILLLPLLSYGGAPMSCTEFFTSANYTESIGNTTNLKYYSGRLGIFKNETSSYIKAYDLSGFDSTSGVLMGSCFLALFEICAYNSSENYYAVTFDTYETKLELEVFFYDSGEAIFEGYFDDGTLSQYDGILYSPENPCSHDPTNNATTCCTSFIPAPEVVGNFPRCKYLRSRSIIHNPIDYSIIATSSMNYFFSDHIIFVRGNFSVATDVLYYINEHEFNSKGGLNGTIFLPRGDVKFFITTYFNQNLYQVPNLRLFLIRNGQILMKEGIPYTKDNDCQYYSVADNLEKMPASVEVCCKEFEL